jgi:hypothetical protein
MDDLEQHIADGMDELTRMYANEPRVVRVGVRAHTPANTIIVGVLDLEMRSALPVSISLRGHAIQLEAEIAGRIEGGPLFVDAEDKAPRQGPIEGGDKITVPRIGGQFAEGTIGVVASEIAFEKDGKLYCKSGPALLSCNHVIAEYDYRPIGAAINVHPHYPYAKLSCYLPYADSSWVHADAALGAIHGNPPTNFAGIKGIGQVLNYRKPRWEEGVRKSGAATGVTAGRINGKKTIKFRDRWWRHTIECSADLWTHGDSGALIVGDDMHGLGIATWKEEGSNICYFWRLLEPGGLGRGQPSMRIIIEH